MIICSYVISSLYLRLATCQDFYSAKSMCVQLKPWMICGLRLIFRSMVVLPVHGCSAYPCTIFNFFINKIGFRLSYSKQIGVMFIENQHFLYTSHAASSSPQIVAEYQHKTRREKEAVQKRDGGHKACRPDQCQCQFHCQFHCQ